MRRTKGQEIAALYIRENFNPSDRLAVVLLNKRSQSVIQRLASAQIIAGPEFQAWLADYNARHFEVYLSMNALTPAARGRTKADVGAIRHVFLDFDKDGTAAVEALRQRADLPRPNYLINTSPDKWQVVWKVEGFGKLQAETLQRGLARVYGADPAATDCARVLRLPGFVNYKYVRAHIVGVEALTPTTYRPEHFPEIAGHEREAALKPGAGHSVRRGPKAPGHLSQSEHDWAYAKRALARGEPPSLVAAAIANYRRFEKHDPENYAERTVRRAGETLRDEFERETSVEPQRA